MTTTAAAGIAVRTVDNIESRGEWQRAAVALHASGLAHSAEWFDAIRDGYGHEPLYLAADTDEGCAGILPAFIVRRPVLGTVITSMPFLDGGGPCAVTPEAADALVRQLLQTARAMNARSVELRCSERLATDIAPDEHKVTLTLELPGDPDVLWRGFDKTVRNQVRKAERSGLTVESGGAQTFEPFYDIFAGRMRELGSPVHAAGFLQSVLRRFGDRARISLVRQGQAAIAGLVTLAFKDRIAVPWAACRKESLPLCPNMLLYWEAIRAACLDGRRWFDFGRSTHGSGTYRFKRQWGASEAPLFWYTFAADGVRGNDGLGSRRLAEHVWQRLPLGITRRIGPRIRKYLIQ